MADLQCTKTSNYQNMVTLKLAGWLNVRVLNQL